MFREAGHRSRRRVCFDGVGGLAPGMRAAPQAAPGPSIRIAQPVDATHVVRLPGRIPSRASPQYDQGAVDPSFQISHMTLELKPSVQQQQALSQLLNDQQDPSSPGYHKWLTAELYADRFGLDQPDVVTLTGWLAQQGFTVTYVARGRNYIAFDGTAGQVRSAFQTEIHRFLINGEQHCANVSQPSIPAAFADVVTGIGGLHDFRPRPLLKKSVIAPADASQLPDAAQLVTLTPSLFASIYDVTPLYTAGFNGTGQKIVIVGQSEPDFADVAAFRKTFNLPVSAPQAVLGGADPGSLPVTSGEVREQNLDLEWSGAVAPGATIIYVYATDAIVALAYAIDNDLAPVMSMSFGLCEPQADPGLFEPDLQKSSSMGISIFVSSGDSGAAGCDEDFVPGREAMDGLEVNYPASSPEVTAVGGTAFTQPAGSGYVPETTWNDTYALGVNVIGLAASGGGASAVFPKTSWQVAPGVPDDGFRDVPDVALASSPYADPYQVINNNQTLLFGGTSAAAPTMAGIVAVLNQYLVAKGVISSPGLGMINPMLYQFSQTSPSAFHDISSGNNEVPCAVNTPNCTTGSFGYAAIPGYDQATGLGSVDANNLALFWSNAPFISFSATSLAFPAQIAGTTSAAQTVTLTNAGKEALPITGITSSKDFSQTNTCGASLAAGANCAISVTFQPSVLGADSGSISIAESLGNPLRINLSGTGLSAVNVSPASLAFGQQMVNTTSAPQTVTLTNNGPTPLTIYNIAIGFSFHQTNTCGTSVASGVSCTISVTFNPVSASAQAQSLFLDDSAAGSPQIVALTGTGYSTVTLSPTSLTFGPQLAGTASAAQTVTLTNGGTTSLAIASITSAGNFTQTNNCGTSVAPAGNCTITVNFRPALVGDQSGSISITDNATNSPQIIGLDGAGISTVNLSATTLNFQKQALTTSSAAQTVTLTNNAAAPLAITSIAVGGLDAGNFIQTNTCGASVGPQSTCTISVIFKPIVVGSVAPAFVFITDSAIGSPQSINLSGTGISVVGLSSGFLTFNNQEIGTTSAAQTVTLTNQGGVPLAIAGIALTGTNGASFALTQNCPASLAPGSACTLSTTFTPPSIGSFTAAITLTDNSSDSPQTIGIGGTGLDFSLGNASTGSTTAAVTAGQTAAYNLQFSQTGGSGDYNITLNCGGAPAEAVCTVSPFQANILGQPNSTYTMPVTVTVTTTAHAAIPAGPLRDPRLSPPVALLSFVGFVLLLLFASLISSAWGEPVRAGIQMTILMACAMTLLIACGGGGTGGGSGGSILLTGTPAGTYTLTVTVNQGTASRTINLILTVN